MRLIEKKKKGFTLLEVLVALLVVAVALGTSIKAIGSLAKNNEKIELNILATWSAENQLNKIRLMKIWPNLGTYNEVCSQGKFNLICEVKVFSTPNPFFRRIEVTVFEKNKYNSKILVLTQLIANDV